MSKDAELTHLDEQGRARMVDVGEKAVTIREATARGVLQMEAATMQALRSGKTAKGDVLAAARIAGIQAAKRTSALIPLCHALALTSVEVHFEMREREVEVRAMARCRDRTGVEMEAMTAASISVLTIYDMLKAVDRGMRVTDIALMEKKGGRSGHWIREESE